MQALSSNAFGCPHSNCSSRRENLWAPKKIQKCLGFPYNIIYIYCYKYLHIYIIYIGIYIYSSSHSTNPNPTVLPGQVFQLSMWLGHWGHPTPKPTLLVSNSPQIASLSKGKLRKSQKRSEFKTAIVYQDKQGKTRYKGSKILRSTQILGNVSIHFFY